MTWGERRLALRDRWLSNPRFQRWAAAFPLTRPVARRRARALFDLCAGFVYSQILYAGVQLKLYEALAAGPKSVAEIAAELSLPPDSARRLLEASAALELLQRRGADRFGLGPLGAALLGNPGVTAMVAHHRLLYTDLNDPVRLLREGAQGGALAGYWAYARSARPTALDEAHVAEYTALMADSQPLVADEVLDAYPLERHRCLLDVGGGDGTFLATAARRHPQLEVVLFDLPAVAARAARRFESLGLGERARAVGGDFHHDPLPRGADVISLVRVIHDHDDAQAAALLRAAAAALPPGGTLLLAEPMSDTAGAGPVGEAYFGFYLLAMGQGRPRSAATLQRMLAEAGFRHSRRVATRQPLQTGLIVANVDHN